MKAQDDLYSLNKKNNDKFTTKDKKQTLSDKNNIDEKRKIFNSDLYDEEDVVRSVN